MAGVTIPLSTRLGYEFRDRELMERALTHRSASRKNNERLEFLGDALIGFVVAEALYQRFPDAKEGELTRLRARLVKRHTLAHIARDIELGAHLRLGGGELKTGGRDRDSILADAFEALIGALYLDGGMRACRDCVLALLESLIERLPRQDTSKDPKTQLQEWLQARKLPLPEYVVLRTVGADHKRFFTVECRLTGWPEAAVGTAGNRQLAEQEAARKALEHLQ